MAQKMMDKHEALEAEERLVVKATEKSLERVGREITRAAAAKGTILSGGTLRALVRTLVEQLESAANRLIAAHAKAGTFDAREIAKRVSSKLDPISNDFLESQAKRIADALQVPFESLRPEVKQFFDSLIDRTTVALAEYPAETRPLGRPGATVNKSGLDPFRVVIGVVAGEQNSDILIELASAAGLRFDTALSGQAAFSHKTRVRELVPRILAAYDALTQPAALGAANALVAALESHGEIFGKATDSLRRVGWDVHNSELVVADPDLREMFFPKGSHWDAYVTLRDLFATALTELVIIDAYCDQTVFQLLAARKDRPLTVRILCWKSATAVAREAKAFAAQFSAWAIHVRQAKDFHDRFVMIDGTSCVHIGASINGAGKSAFMISKVEDQANRDALLTQIEATWSAATQVL